MSIERTLSPYTEAALTAELELLSAPERSTVRIYGSIGRTAVYGYHSRDPHIEFTARNVNPLGSAQAPRDIDVIGIETEESAIFQPYPLDITGHRSAYSRLVHDRNDWYLVADHHAFAVELHPDTMEPLHSRGVYGARLVTFPLQTHINLHGIEGGRSKDALSLQIMQSVEERLSSTERKREELYRPFQELRQLNQQSIYLRSRALYRNIVPVSLRTRLVPLMRVAKQIAGTS